MTLNQLPKLKHQLAETTHLLSRLEESKDSISQERYEKLSQTYKTKIEDLEKQVDQLTDDGSAQKFELEQKIRDIDEKVSKIIDEEYREITLLHERQAVSYEEYKQKTKDYKGEKRLLERELSKQRERLKELEFYLTQVGDLDYTKHKVQQKADVLRGEVTSATGKVREIVTPRRLVTVIIILIVIIGGYWGISKLSLTGTVTDIDGNVYKTVKIGDQLWMAENLKTTRYRNGDAIPTNLDNTQWSNTTSGAYAIYPHGSVDGINSEAGVVAAYGKLYNWYAVDDSRGLCPEGWRVPSDSDWSTLVNYLVAQGYPNTDVVGGAGNALKSRRQVNSPLGAPWATSVHPRWDSHSTHYGLDGFGFSGLPGGGRDVDGSYLDVGVYGLWWSSTEDDADYTWFRNLVHYYGDVGGGYYDRQSGFSVRCLRNF